MFIKQLYDSASSTYTYILADESAKLAIIIDPVVEHINEYVSFLETLNFNLIAALDTHVHADHVTALGALKNKTQAQTYLGNPGEVKCADHPLNDGQAIQFGNYNLTVIYTPGHTDDSYCFLVKANNQCYLFTGDTLLIGGTGRTDFQNGNAGDLYDSLHNKLLTLPDDTIVYPGHDYHGNTQSTIGLERTSNARIKIKDKAAFIDFMSKLDLPNPKQMDIAVPANKRCGNAIRNQK